MAGKGEGPAMEIDLGTTYSCVGVWQHDRVEIISNDQGNRTTPSYVAFTDSERLIGDAAKNQVAMNPINTVFEKKMNILWRKMGGLRFCPNFKLVQRNNPALLFSSFSTTRASYNTLVSEND
uniref:Uncharacterized protein n=1 Tax=Cucumis melo TaxID=3656 RepID=A0A9I9E4Z2_CUCME